MRWILQENMFWEGAVDRLFETLQRLQLPTERVKSIPFGGGTEPPLGLLTGPTVAVGSISLVQQVMHHGGKPGGWMNPETFTHEAYELNQGEHMLNAGSIVTRFADATNHDLQEFFIRPVTDEKLFAGMIIDRWTFEDWAHKISFADNMWTITPDTMVVVSPVRKIFSETRFFVVRGEVITGSLYKRGDRVLYSDQIDDDILAFARERAAHWTPDTVAVMDIAQTPDGPKIVEYNAPQSAGWYDCDVQKIVGAIEDLEDDF